MGVRNLSNCLYSEQGNRFKVPLSWGSAKTRCRAQAGDADGEARAWDSCGMTHQWPAESYFSTICKPLLSPVTWSHLYGTGPRGTGAEGQAVVGATQQAGRATTSQGPDVAREAEEAR